MRKTRVALHLLIALTLLGAAIGAPAFAGTVYVPLMVDQTAEGHLVQTEVTIGNTSPTEIRAFSYTFLPSGTDGTIPNRDDAGEFFVSPGASATFTDLIDAGQAGILEIEGDPEITVSSRLVSTSVDGVVHEGTVMPIVGATSAFAAGAKAHILGWTREPQQRRSDFHLINLGSGEAICSVTIRAAAGDIKLDSYQIAMQPLSHVVYSDALGIIGVPRAGSMSSTVSCDRQFYTYLTTLDLPDGDVVFVPPSTSASDSLGTTPPDDSGPLPDGSFVYEAPGLVHSPSPAQPIRQINIPMADARYSKVTIDMEFTPNGWGLQPDKLHSIFWFNRQPKWSQNLFGYFNAFGPNKNEVKLSYNVGLPPATLNVQPTKQTLQSGVTYKVHWEYDTDTGVTFAEVRTLSGDTLSRTQMPTNTNAVWAENGGFFISFGFSPNAHGPEQVTYGWKYSNVRIVWTP